MVKFTNGNSKINKLAKKLGLKKTQVVSFDLPAGWTCPCADICKSKANRVTGYLTDGKDCKFRCYAASTEAYSGTARRLRWHNFEALKNAGKDAVKLLSDSLPVEAKIVRVHSSGDFFNKDYFLAWCKFVALYPDVIFFGYTKVPAYVNAPKPDNFKLVYSHGGKRDSEAVGLPTCYVSASPESEYPDVPVSCKVDPSDDYDFIMAGKSFVLSIHGTQPKKK